MLIMECQWLYILSKHLYILSNELNESGQEETIVFEMGTGGEERKKLIEAKELMLDMIVHRGYIYISFSDFFEQSITMKKTKKKEKIQGFG